MGGGSYNVSAKTTRSSMLYSHVTKDNLDTVFRQKAIGGINEQLDPKGVTFREARDNAEHPESLAVLIGLDVTGSMGDIPAKLINTGLPTMIQKIFDSGIADPQVGFVSVGDHECDSYPLQVGQFESSDELIDKSLQVVNIEQGGGGNGGESYLLAWYHAAFHTSIDCFEKRGQKGILVTIGDEPNLKSVPGTVLAELYGLQSEKDYTASELLSAASQMYDVYHINVGSTYSGSSKRVQDGWAQTLGENFINVDHYSKVPEAIAEAVSKSYTGTRQDVVVQDAGEGQVTTDEIVPETNSGDTENIML